jgi:hypothetical protein
MVQQDTHKTRVIFCKDKAGEAARDEAYKSFYQRQLTRGPEGYLSLNATSKSSFWAGWESALTAMAECDALLSKGSPDA